MKEKLTPIGYVTAVLRGPDGKIKDVWTKKNRVVTTGKNHIANRMGDLSQGAMSHMAIGTGTAESTDADTALETENVRVDLELAPPSVVGNVVTYLAQYPPGTGVGLISEAGIFNANSGGVMLCRTQFDGKDKGSGDSLQLTWTITFV